MPAIKCAKFGGSTREKFDAALRENGHTIAVEKFTYTSPKNAAPQIRVPRNTTGDYRDIREALQNGSTLEQLSAVYPSLFADANECLILGHIAYLVANPPKSASNGS